MRSHPQWDDPRFGARVEITSAAAAALRDDAEKLVNAYLTGSHLTFEEGNPYTVGALHVNPAKARPFTNALHDAYDLNGHEQEVAEALDATGHPWARNPSQSGYSIPLLDVGDTQRFFPDFLVWKDGLVFAVDPKGGNLLAKDAGRKLLNIMDEHRQRKVVVRLITRDKWNDQLVQVGGTGFTVWSVFPTTGRPKARHVPTVTAAVAAALKA